MPADFVQTWSAASRFLETELFTIKGTSITPASVIAFTATLVAGVVVGRLLKRAVIRFMVRDPDDQTEGAAYSIGRILQYLVFVAGALLALENVGISLTTLAALGAVLMVGIGFGLQNITQNFISGIILLVERPVSKGDVVIVDGTYGIVDEVMIRATRVMTFDNISMIVPNSKLISEVVENRSQPTTVYRIRIRVGVAYGTDPDAVEEALLGVAKECDAVLSDPEPSVFFMDFGDSALVFDLAIWLDDPKAALGAGTDVRKGIARAFHERGITIPFPQRDLHVKTPVAVEA